MMKSQLTFSLLVFSHFFCFSQETAPKIKDSLQWSGQISVLAHYNPENSLPVFFGGRYIPALNYTITLPGNKLIDFEASANIAGSYAFLPSDSSFLDGSIHTYRAWARYSGSQFEIRAGLQKINFGSATLLRPLMWFDNLDSRDPLKLTNGMWGILGRYYFLNNTNVWFWCLYGNDKSRSWDIGNTVLKSPELGGRFQTSVPKGEIALSYNYRHANTMDIGNGVPAYAEIPENRLGLDGKWDIGMGIWFEGTWIHKSKNIGTLTNQELLSIGTDYTFNIGEGVNVMYEQLLAANDESAFEFKNHILFSAISINYPIGILDNLSAVVYFDWQNAVGYNFVNWNHRFKRISLYVMAYWNPEHYNLPQQGSSSNMYSKQGIQIMLVYNH